MSINAGDLFTRGGGNCENSICIKVEAGEMCFTRRELQEAISHPSSAEGKLLKRFSERFKKEICFNWSKIILPLFCVCFAFLCSENESVST